MAELLERHLAEGELAGAIVATCDRLTDKGALPQTDAEISLFTGDAEGFPERYEEVAALEDLCSETLRG